jgi:hypothetical protein
MVDARRRRAAVMATADAVADGSTGDFTMGSSALEILVVPIFLAVGGEILLATVLVSVVNGIGALRGRMSRAIRTRKLAARVARESMRTAIRESEPHRYGEMVLTFAGHTHGSYRRADGG